VGGVAVVQTTQGATTVGRIVVALTVVNHEDEIAARRGDIPAEAIRSVDLENVLVDTGATSLCLPPDVIAQLGLPALGQVRAKTAAGTRRVQRYEDAKVRLLGREGTFTCVELPTGTPALLGQIPLEELGLEPNMREQRLQVLPLDTDDTYITVL
jgi:clan AA aspartic protease